MKKFKKLIWLIPLLAIMLSSMQCRKNANELPKTELEKLPPITQTGANTFGCLVNGVAWLPNGSKPPFGGSNKSLYVDPTFQGGSFYASGYKFKHPNEFVTVGSSQCTAIGVYNFDDKKNGIQYSFINNNQTITLSGRDNWVYSKGFLSISKYDLTSGIFSGTFEGTLFYSNEFQDTIKITKGRFDLKF